MKIKKRVFTLVILVAMTITLTGCRGKSVSADKITYAYHERFESVEITNNLKEDVYANFNIVLLNEKNDILYKVVFEKEVLKKGSQYYNLEEITPEYIAYDKIASMDVEILKVNEINYAIIIVILAALVIAAKKYFDIT